MARAKKLEQFLALLKKTTKRKDLPLSKLCQSLQHSPPNLEKLVTAMAQDRHWATFLTSIQVVQACALVHMHKKQYESACALLESCRATEKEELVQIWNEVHHRQVMEKHRIQSLTPVQKFRCRKKNPPPASLCPEGMKNRNYPNEVRQRLQRFAIEVTA